MIDNVNSNNIESEVDEEKVELDNEANEIITDVWASNFEMEFAKVQSLI